MQRRSESIVIAPPSQRPILAALTDLSAAGLLAPFQWLESTPGAGQAAGADDNPRVLRVSQGRTQVHSYSEVAGRHDLDLVRVIAVVPLGHPARDALDAMDELHYLNLPVAAGAHKQPVRVLVPWSPEPVEAVVGHPGWSNVMLSPEPTSDPAFPATAWWLTPEQIPAAAAVGIAVQAGIAGSVEQAPTDQDSTASGSSVRVVRTFVRHVDASAVEQTLRHQVMSVGQTLPQPVRPEAGGGHVYPFHDPHGRVVAMANEWFSRHYYSLRRQSAAVPVVEQEQVGALQALRLFFSFMVKAVLGAPGAWLRSQIRGVKATVAAKVEGFVFGAGSAVSVVVGGVDASGRTAGWRELAAAAREASSTMPTEMPQLGVPRPRSFAALWQDLVNGCQALADGSGYAELKIIPNEGYIRDRDILAPARDAGGSYVFAVPVGPFPAGTQLRCWDQMEIRRVMGELAALSQAGGPDAAEAARVWGEIQRWQQEGSYRLLPLIGSYLTQVFDQTRADLNGYYEQLRALVAEDETEALETRQRRIARIMRILLGIFVIVLLISLGLAALGEITWLIAGIVAGVAFVSWIVSSIWTFVVQQRGVFRLLHLARTRETLVPVLSANLRLAIEDLSAQGEAYAQFDRWASVLTSFMSDPLGEQDTQRTTEDHAASLPAAFQSVEAQAGQSTIETTAAELRIRVFKVGWLKEAWQALGSAIAADLSPDEVARLMRRDLDVFAEAGTGETALTHWAAGLESHGVRSGIGAAYWEECLTALAQGVNDSLALEVVPPSGASRPLSQYRQDLERFRQTTVVTGVFAPGRYAGTEPQTRAEGHWFRERRDGLSTTMAMTDATTALTSDYFVYPAPAKARAAATDSLVY